MSTPNKPLFLTVNHLFTLYRGVRSTTWCYELYRTIKVAYGLNRSDQIPTVRQYANYVQMEIGDVYAELGYGREPIIKKVA